jgi:hypothetical protein
MTGVAGEPAWDSMIKMPVPGARKNGVRHGGAVQLGT